MGSFYQNYGNVASVWGLVLAALGFPLTLVGLWVTFRAAREARRAALRVQSRMLAVDAVADLATVAAGLREIEALHRARDYGTARLRYGEVRRQLVVVKAASAQMLTVEQSDALQGAIQQLHNIQNEVERLPRGAAPDGTRFNAALRPKADHLLEVLAAIRIRQGVDNG